MPGARFGANWLMSARFVAVVIKIVRVELCLHDRACSYIRLTVLWGCRVFTVD